MNASKKSGEGVTQGTPLDNLRDEMIAQKLIEYKGDVVRAYEEVTGVQHESARSTAYRVIADDSRGIRERALSILNAQSNGTLPAILKELSNQVVSNKTLLTKKGPIQAPDNPSRLQAITIALKMYNILNDKADGPSYNTIINNVTIEDAERMSTIADRLRTDRERMLEKYKDYSNEAEVIL